MVVVVATVVVVVQVKLSSLEDSGRRAIGDDQRGGAAMHSGEGCGD